MKVHLTYLAGAAALAIAASASAQEQPQPPATPSPPVPDAGAAPPALDEFGDEEEIVIQGSRPRGSVIGDIPPQNVLDSRDVRATGATSISELLDALAPQIGSAQGRSGGRPIMLLNGQRVSGFRELRDIPTEAIQRVEILPEEVALKYGYRADQKVVNIVLRERFRSTTAQAGARVATDGGYAGANGDVTQFRVDKNGRTTVNVHAEGNGVLTEAERDIALAASDGSSRDQLAARSLLPSKRDVRAAATVNRQILGDVSATLNAEAEHSEGRSLIGLGDTLLQPLGRQTSSDSAHFGGVLNGMKKDWRWTVTGNADLQRSRTGTDRDDTVFARDRSRQTTASGDVKATANGKLFKLPAGDVSTTISLSGSTINLDSERVRSGISDANTLGRTTGEAAINIDLPVSRRGRDFSAIGNLTLNGNAAIQQLSDFGTLTSIGAGANWSPADRLSFITSWSREDGPPTINQLGDPILETPGTRIFDFTTGETALVTAITGGNPDLRSDRRTVFKLGTNWQPFEKTDLRLRGEYVHQKVARPISSVSVTPTLEAAFPDRFVRDDTGRLVSVDLTPLNFDSSTRDTLRLGFDFSKPLKSRRPSQAVIDQFRSQFARGRPPAAPANSPSSEPAAGPPPDRPESARGSRGGGRFFGGSNRGRLTFSLTDTITLADQVKVGPGVPEIDYLHGDAAGQSGGTPRHRIEAQSGYFNNGIGARISANWRSATKVRTLGGDELSFSPLATFDLRLFANPGDIPEVAVKHPWLRGTQVRLQVDNLFNARPRVRDDFGSVPLSYQPGLLDPLGRTVMISFRKLFLPNRNWYRRQSSGRGGG